MYFRAKIIRKIMYTPVSQNITVNKWGVRGCKIARACYTDGSPALVGARFHDPSLFLLG